MSRTRRALFAVVIALAAFAAAATCALAGGYRETAVWGVKGTARGELLRPKGAAIDRSGFVYVVDYANHTVIKYSPAGAVVRVWGGKGSAVGKLDRPSRIAIGPDGSLYVTDAVNQRIQRFGPNGDVLGVWGREGDGPGEFRFPRGIDVAADGTVYVTDQGNARVQVFTAAGRYLRMWGSRGPGRGQFGIPKDVAVSPGGRRVYVADARNDNVQAFTPDGRWVTSWGRHGSGPRELKAPRGVLVDGRGNVFVADAGNSCIKEYRPDGAFVRLWGASGTATGLMARPRDVAEAPDHSLVVVDTDNCRLERFVLDDAADGQAPRTSSDVSAKWSRVPVTVRLTAVDAGSGVAATYAYATPRYRYSPVTGPLTVAREGRTWLSFFSVDEAGNQELARTQMVAVDRTRPTVTPRRLPAVRVVAGQSATLAVVVADRYSPTCWVTVRATRNGRPVRGRDLGWLRVSRPGTPVVAAFGGLLAPGRYRVVVTACDRAGNTGSSSGALVVTAR